MHTHEEVERRLGPQVGDPRRGGAALGTDDAAPGAAGAGVAAAEPWLGVWWQVGFLCMFLFTSSAVNQATLKKKAPFLPAQGFARLGS